MKPLRLAVLSGSLFAVAACDGLAPPVRRGAVEYRPERSGSVDHAMCLLGFAAAPLQRLITGHQLVDGSLNGRPATFILDTGANLTVVNQAHAEAFGLRPQGGVVGAAAGVGGALRASRARIESLRLHDRTIRQRHVLVADLSQVDRVLGRLSPQPIHGIVGQDVLRAHHAVIDVARPMLYLLPAGSEPAPVTADRCGGEAVGAR